jgi:hypothetical protein
MPIDRKKIGKMGLQPARRSGTRIGKSDPLLQDIVVLVNEFPERVTLTGLAETMQLRGKYLDVKMNNLRSRIRRRLDILCDQLDLSGKPVLLRKSELRVDAFDETDGSIRYVWYTPEYEEEMIGERLTIDEFRLLLTSVITEEPEYIQKLFEDWKPSVTLALDVEGWKIEFWQYVRKNIKDDLLWCQYYAAELGVEQDAIMQKSLVRRFSGVIDTIWERMVVE